MGSLNIALHSEYDEEGKEGIDEKARHNGDWKRERRVFGFFGCTGRRG
jgi:hypothetical protein